MVNLQSITIDGANPRGVKHPLPAQALRNLRHVEIFSNYEHFSMNLLWSSMKAAGTRLDTLTTAQVSLKLVDYLASYSGLKYLKIYDIITHSSCSSSEVTSSFFNRALPRHTSTLESLSLSYTANTRQIRGWDFYPASWDPLLPRMSALKSLHIPPYRPGPTAFIETASMIASQYQTVLDSVQLAPNLEVLEIYWPSQTFDSETTRENWERKLERILRRVVPELTCTGDRPRPKELRLFNGTYCATRPNGGFHWKYTYVSPDEFLAGSS